MASGVGDGTDDGVAASARPRGRPRGRRSGAGTESADTRGLIVAAAAHEFARNGYDATSMRAIARRAGVDPALVHHYFSEKAELFATSLSAPVRPDVIVREILNGPRERMGENLVRLVVTTLDEPSARDRMIALLHTALGQEFAAKMVREYLLREVLRRIAKAIGGERAELRATLAASQIVGLILVRYGVRVDPLASAGVEEIVTLIGPVVQWHLTGIPPVVSGIDTASAPGE